MRTEEEILKGQTRGQSLERSRAMTKTVDWSSALIMEQPILESHGATEISRGIAKVRFSVSKLTLI
jgi:hypothetical protein